MPLRPGSTLGSFEITGPLGEGGMGQVFRARDTRLQRDVAVKVLPDSFADHPERLARFKREAQTLAALNHPNIAAIYGFEEIGTTRALIMEFVDGRDLSAVIARGPISPDDALPIARQIADALEAAHDKGVIHRDLKPANVKIGGDGGVKVLDFGLAKMLDAAESSGGTESRSTENSPTLTAAGFAPGTQLGIILGTAAYMAPEQARGRIVDRRADIWAFGVVLFEMLTGSRAFKGDDISEILAAVLKTEPDWSALPASTPPAIHRLLRRCLEKDPRKRLSAISDARLELDEAAAAPAVARSDAQPRRSIVSYLGPAVAGAVVAAGLAFLFWPKASPVQEPLSRTSLVPPPGVEIWGDSPQVSISPNGQFVVFVSGNPIDRQNAKLFVRAIDSLAAKALEGTEGAGMPFWKPDSSRIGFFAGTKLKSIPVEGGRADVIADAPFGRGGTWNERDVIVFAGDASGMLSKVLANGGEVTRVTTLDKDRKEVGHRMPVFLPDGDHFLFAALPGHEGRFNILAGSISSPAVTLVGAMGSAPVYADPGWLLYGRRGVLVAQPFDPKTLKTTGDARPLGDEPTTISDPSINFTAGHTATVSKNGSLAYFSGPASSVRAVLLDTSGRITSTVPIQPGPYTAATLSPDGTQAVFVQSISPTESNLILVDVARGGSLPLSVGSGRNEAPVWSPDGKQILFSSDRDGAQNLFVKPLADTGPERPMYQSEPLFKTPTDWSRDGKWIMFYQLDPVTNYNVYRLPASGGAATKTVEGRNRDGLGHISPDGKWLAYLAEFGETGFQLCVQAFPAPGRSFQLTTDGAGFHAWTSDSRAIIYSTSNRKDLWRVDIQPSGADLSPGRPVKLGALPTGTMGLSASFDGQKLLALMPDRLGDGSVTLVRNWMAALGR